MTAPTVQILQGDALSVLQRLPSASVQCVVTSPPYFGLRAYGTNPQVWGGDRKHDPHEWGEPVRSLNANAIPGPSTNVPKNGAFRSVGKEAGAFCPCGAWRGELGSEPTPALFIEHLVAVFDEVRRVLHPSGVVFCNLGDSYSGSGKGPQGNGLKKSYWTKPETENLAGAKTWEGIPAKNLLLIPERFAIAMQDAGWIVRSQIVWSKASCMPESVRDRFTSAWEPIWMFTKSARYFFDQEAVREPAMMTPQRRLTPHPIGRGPAQQNGVNPVRDTPRQDAPSGGANMRNVWHLSPEPLKESHYAAFPSEIPRRCILAGTSERGGCPACGAPWVRVVERDGKTARQQAYEVGYGPSAAAHGDNPQGLSFNGSHWKLPPRTARDLGWQPGCACKNVGPPIPQTVLDPFLGSGTTALVAHRLGRSAIGIELNPEYCRLAEERLKRDAGPMFDEGIEVMATSQPSLFDATEAAG